jgi:hypothetical protein
LESVAASLQVKSQLKKSFETFSSRNQIIKFQAHVDVQMKTLTPYYNSVINTTLDICEFVNGTSKNLATKWFFDIMKTTLPPGLFHVCPYVDEMKAYNMTLNEDYHEASQFLVGSYRSITRFFDGKDENIITVKHFVEFKDVRKREMRPKKT